MLNPDFFASLYLIFNGAPKGGFVNTFVNLPFLKEFVSNVSNSLDNRCGYCYLSRLENTALYASQNGYDAFSTTLFISPYQNHDLVKKICENLSKKYNIKFLYRDFRPYYYEGKTMFKETGLYMQKYCGCVFSEEERYQKRIDKRNNSVIVSC